MATVTIPAGTYGPGTLSLGPVVVPSSAVRVDLTLDATQHTNPVIVASLAVDVSLDGGVTWIGNSTPGDCAVGASRPGNSNAAVTADLRQIRLTYPLPAVANRAVRASVIITGGAVATAGGVLTVT
jgi:hypothetical protein